MLRIINEGKLKYFSLGYSCKPEFWDAAASELRNGYPNARKINLLLSKKKNQLEDVILDFQSEEKDFSNCMLSEQSGLKRHLFNVVIEV